MSLAEELTIDTGYKPHRHQQAIHMGMKRFSVLVCHRRFGKTVAAINTLIDAALKRDGGRYAYIAPYLKQARQVAFDLLLQYTRPIPGVKINRSESYVELPNGARITLYGSDNDQAMRGLGFDGVVCDEIADFRKETWPEVVRPALADRQGWCLFIGTPKGMNQFYELYQQAVKDPTWYAGLYRVDETNLPWLPPEELELAKSVMSTNAYRQEWLCDFTASSDNVLITIDEVAAACARVEPLERALIGLPKTIGVDVARFGDDRSVIQRRWGHVAYEPLVFQGIDNMRLASMVAQEIADFEPDATFVDAGRGEGVIDRLRQLGGSVIEVNFGGKPINPRFANKRAEIWWQMAEWVKAGGVLPNNPELKSDLCAPTYSFNAADKLVLESKDAMRERGIRSPDLAEALATTFAMPVLSVRQGVGGKPNIITDHD